MMGLVGKEELRNLLNDKTGKLLGAERGHSRMT